MTKRNSTISINILSALIILISLFVAIVGNVNAWFTSEHREGIQMIINIGDLKLNLYQRITGQENLNEVYTYDENNKETTTEKKYITFKGKVLPDVQNYMELILTNEDQGSAAMYLRFKFELYARGGTEDVLIPTVLDGVDELFEYKTKQVGNDDSGYYYYKASTNANSANGLFAQNTEGVNLMTYFKINYDDMLDSSGNLINVSSETLYIKLTVEAQVDDWLGGVAW